MSRINNITTEPIPKPEPREKKKPKYIKAKTDYQWTKTRNEYLKNAANHQGYYKCEECGKYQAGVEVHHKETKGSRADLKYDLRNLIALCGTCHGAKHGQNR